MTFETEVWKVVHIDAMTRLERDSSYDADVISTITARPNRETSPSKWIFPMSVLLSASEGCSEETSSGFTVIGPEDLPVHMKPSVELG